MKLLRYGPVGEEKPGLLDNDGVVRDLSGYVEDIADAALTPEGLERLSGIDPSTLTAVEDIQRLGPCVGGVGKIPCIGLNYRDHAAEMGHDIPTEPVMFMKATSALCGPTDDIIIPKGSTKLDWEVELAIIIGKPGKNIAEADAMDHVAGYALLDDVSERAFQIERGGQWLKGKSADTFAPLGPWLVTKDEVLDPHALDIWLSVDGDRMQNGNTRTMIFPVQTVVSYVSEFMSLQSGDVIATGTPPGVGGGRKPPRFLKAGEVVTLGISGLGEQRHVVVDG